MRRAALYPDPLRTLARARHPLRLLMDAAACGCLGAAIVLL